MTRMPPIIIHDIAHHRNGVGGEPFYVVRFTDRDERLTFIATVFPPDPITSGDKEGEPDWTYSEGYQNPRVAVLALDKLPDITFGKNSWRGDRYAPALFAAIVAEERENVTV